MSAARLPRGRPTAGLLVLPLMIVASLAADDVIRTSTRLVEINVLVRDKSGPVTNLEKGDFVLFDQGKRLKIAFFSVDSALTERARKSEAPRDSFTNQPVEGASPAGITVILLDTLNTKFEDQAYAKRQFVQFLQNANPKDRVAVYLLGSSLRVLSDFTGDIELLKRSLSEHTGAVSGSLLDSDFTKSDTGNADVDRVIDHANAVVGEAATSDRAAATMAALSAIVNHVANFPGRKNLIWLTGSVPISGLAVAKAFNKANVAVYPIDARGLIGLPGVLAAGAAGPRRVGGPPQTVSFTPGGLATMQDLADQTGGHAFYDRNDLGNAIRMAIDDSSFTYTLGFYPDASSLNGKLHELKLQLKRPALNLSYRKWYFAARDVPATEEETAANLQVAMASPLESSTLPLQVEVKHEASSLKVHCVVDVHHLQLARRGDSWVGSVDVFVVQQDKRGKIIDGTRDTHSLQLTREQYESYLKFGMGLAGLIEPKEDMTTIRVLVADRSNAAVGSVIIPVSLIKGP